MSQSIPAVREDTRTTDQIMADLDRLRAQIRANNPEMTDADWEALADRWAADVDEGLRAHVRKSRGEFQ